MRDETSSLKSFSGGVVGACVQQRIAHLQWHQKGMFQTHLRSPKGKNTRYRLTRRQLYNLACCARMSRSLKGTCSLQTHGKCVRGKSPRRCATDGIFASYFSVSLSVSLQDATERWRRMKAPISYDKSCVTTPFCRYNAFLATILPGPDQCS